MFKKLGVDFDEFERQKPVYNPDLTNVPSDKVKDIVQRIYIALINNQTINDGDGADIAAGLILVAYFLLNLIWKPTYLWLY